MKIRLSILYVSASLEFYTHIQGAFDMLDQLLLSMGLNWSGFDQPLMIAQRHQQMAQLVSKFEQNPTLKSLLPFPLKLKVAKLSESAHSPIYAVYRNGLCEIRLNSAPETHLNYQVLAYQQAGQHSELSETSMSYALGHEIGHCMYRHLSMMRKPVTTVYPIQKDYLALADAQHPEALGPRQRALHEEVYADEYGIELTAKALNEDESAIRRQVIAFRQAMTAFDSLRSTHYYLPRPVQRTALRE